jgi:hypothetical protein
MAYDTNGQKPYRNIRDVLFLHMKIFVICVCELQPQITNLVCIEAVIQLDQ